MLKIKKIIGPSPAISTIKKFKRIIFCHGGSSVHQDQAPSVAEYVEVDPEPPIVEAPRSKSKPPRILTRELNDILRKKAKQKLTRDEKLIKSVVDQAELSRVLSEYEFESLAEYYAVRRKYKNYLRFKRFIPIAVVAPLTNTELTKMAYAAAINSKSVALTIPGVIGFSLPAYFFFHMAYFYASDKVKPVCQLGKYTFGAGFMMVSYLLDELSSSIEEDIFGEAVPTDLNKSGGTIPNDIGTIDDVRKMLKDLRDTTDEFTKKTY